MVPSLHGDLSDQRKDKADTLVTNVSAVVDKIVDAVFLVVNTHNLHESDTVKSKELYSHPYNSRLVKNGLVHKRGLPSSIFPSPKT